MSVIYWPVMGETKEFLALTVTSNLSPLESERRFPSDTTVANLKVSTPHKRMTSFIILYHCGGVVEDKMYYFQL